MERGENCEAEMVDPISNAPSLHEIGAAQARPQVSSQTASGAPDPATNLPPDQRVAVVQAAVEKLIKKSLPANSKLQVVQDKETGAFIYRSIDPDTGKVISQWPPEQLVKMHEYLAQLAGILLDKQV
jgi:flagellar protein FlaG